MAVWQLYLQCEGQGGVPSTQLGIAHNRWLAWQFNDAVFTFGRHIQNTLAKCQSDQDRLTKLRQLLGVTSKMTLKPINVASLTSIRGIRVARE